VDQVQIYQIDRHRVAIACRGTVLPPTPYSLCLAEHIPEMPGHTVVDVGTGSGILGIDARWQGAARVYVRDINPEAIAVAMENATRNAVQEGCTPVPTGRTMLPLPAGTSIDVVLCNPAQLPLPESAKADDPCYAGQDGRQMIEGVIRETPPWLSPAGRLLMTHNSLTDYQQARPIQEAVGGRAGLAPTLTNIGLVYDDLGQPEQALPSYQQALPIVEAVGDRAGESITRYNLAMMYRCQGQLAEAVEALRRVVA
jgi:methylase of polypeptide subunit release factors